MSAKNTFDFRRFLMLFKQYYIHNNKLMIYSTIGFCGVVFIVLSLVQLEEMIPFDNDYFLGFFLPFVGIFGILIIGHSFPAFRSTETSINYLILPASRLEKFLFELIFRLGSTLVILPILYWLTFHLQGYFFQLFIEDEFQPITFYSIATMGFGELEDKIWIPVLIFSMTMLALTVPFAGSAHFAKQPLVKTLFFIALVILFFLGFFYMVFEVFGLENYRLTNSIWLIPHNSMEAYRFFSLALILGNVVMLLVAFLKLKEKEV